MSTTQDLRSLFKELGNVDPISGILNEQLTLDFVFQKDNFIILDRNE